MPRPERAAAVPQRIVALGASNLMRGLPALVSAARQGSGPDVEVLAALGAGRSYGAPSRVLVRTLPGILQSGIWSVLEALPSAPTRALVTDVGNDILYGSSPEQILAWVEECVDRLLRATSDVRLTSLPLFSIRRLSPSRFVFFRSVLFPRCRLSHQEVVDGAERVASGLERLAANRKLSFLHLRPEWYGFDPIHIRLRSWGKAWQEMLSVDHDQAALGRASIAEAVRLYGLFPERQWLFGLEQRTHQPGIRLSKGGRVRLF